MNFFPLNRDPQLAAIDNCDKHVVKIPVEIAQMLSTVCDRQGVWTDKMYRPSFANHPITLWASESYLNAMWLVEHGIYLSEEYSYRYHFRTHASSLVIFECLKNLTYELNWTKNVQTEFAQAMPDDCKHEDSVLAYRNYYIQEKSYFATWTKRVTPDWFLTSTLLCL